MTHWLTAPPVTAAEWGGLDAARMFTLLPVPDVVGGGWDEWVRDRGGDCRMAPYRYLAAAVLRLRPHWWLRRVAAALEAGTPGEPFNWGAFHALIEGHERHASEEYAYRQSRGHSFPPSDYSLLLLTYNLYSCAPTGISIIAREVLGSRPGRTLRAKLDEVVREVVGYPWRPGLRPEWRTADVLALARGAWVASDWGRLPILADALQDAGCDRADVLDHIRGSGPHARGCWALTDVLLPPPPPAA